MLIIIYMMNSNGMFVCFFGFGFFVNTVAVLARGKLRQGGRN